MVGSGSAKKQPVSRSLREPTATPSILQRPKNNTAEAIEEEETEPKAETEEVDLESTPVTEPEQRSEAENDIPEKSVPRAGERMTAIVTELIKQQSMGAYEKCYRDYTAGVFERRGGVQGKMRKTAPEGYQGDDQGGD